MPLAIASSATAPESESSRVAAHAAGTIDVDTMLQAVKLVDSVDVLLGFWDRDLRCKFANEAYKTWFGRSRQDILGMSMKELLGPLYEVNLPHVLGALNGEVRTFERQMQVADGSFRHALATYYPVVADGDVEGIAVQVTDVTRMKRLELELEEARREAVVMATHDSLTGLPNRVLLLDRIAYATAVARRTGRRAGVVAIDLDDFKTVNDTLGHAAGDALLVEIAERMRAAIRGTDTISRMGGDEFILLASEVESVENLLTVIRRIQVSVCRPFSVRNTVIVPRLSFGVALFPGHGSDPSDLLARADTALYQAKRQGKNCFILAEAEGSEDAGSEDAGSEDAGPASDVVTPQGEGGPQAGPSPG